MGEMILPNDDNVEAMVDIVSSLAEEGTIDSVENLLDDKYVLKESNLLAIKSYKILMYNFKKSFKVL